MRVYHKHSPRNTIPFSETLEMWVIIAGFIGAFFLLRSDAIAWLIGHTESFAILGVFVEGFFFTSMLTTVPATVAILQSAAVVPAWQLALVGGLGSMAGDVLLFRFLRTNLVERILEAAFRPKLMQVGKAIERGPFSWLPPLLGFFVIASPLPDEVGLVMMGLSRIRLVSFALLNFAAHALGIFILALAAQGIGS